MKNVESKLSVISCLYQASASALQQEIHTFVTIALNG